MDAHQDERRLGPAFDAAPCFRFPNFFLSSKGTSLRRLHRMGPLLGKDDNGSRDRE